MGDILESFLRVAMVVFIVGPLTAWVARRGARERSEATDSLDRFTVRMPAAIRTIIACCAVAFELLMLGVYVWQGVSLGEWDHELVWFGHAMALAGMAIWALLSIPRIDVDGERILSRNAFGIRKETTFGNITRATLHTQMMRIDLFEGDRKFCSISLEGVCSLNLLARLEEEGIEVSDAVDGPMTKAGLCWSAIKPLTIVFNGMALVFSLVIAFMAVFTDAGARLLLLVPCLFLFIGGLLPLLMLSMPARGIYEIGRQERELGFSFAEEMASRGATGTSLVDDDWFIEISNARVVAFRRDYLKKVTAHEDSESGDRCTVTTKGGRKIKVYAAGSTLEDLRSWFKQGAKARSTLDRAEDVLETTSDWVV
ncbi:MULTISPECIES: hypothetical protein [unclassified Collinsella]|uniref:hypothetical protein n=1 Tax=unclassified Collinsella TaxID=2637548 RepID=UPI001F195F05|nr:MULTISPECIES: hypothetical protein [unclassified Collinsella]